MSLLNRLNKRIAVLKPPTTKNSFGEIVGKPEVVCKVWAAIEPLRGREYIAAYGEQVDITTRIRIRYRAGIDRSMIIHYEHDEVEFEILDVINPVFGQKELQLMCKERQ